MLCHTFQTKGRMIVFSTSLGDEGSIMSHRSFHVLEKANNSLGNIALIHNLESPKRQTYLRKPRGEGALWKVQAPCEWPCFWDCMT